MMIENPFQSHRFSHHLRRLRVVGNDPAKIPLLERASVQPETETKFGLVNKPVKAVHFSRRVSYYEKDEPLLEEDIENIWYREKDFKVFKQISLRIARDIRKNDAHKAAGLDHCLDLAKTFSNDVNDQTELESLLQSLPAPSAELQNWCTDQSLRGLERLSSRAINDYVYNNQICRSKVKLFRKFDEESIRMMQEQDSRSSCVLARWIAMADAIAASIDDTSDTTSDPDSSDVPTDDDLDASWTRF